MAPNDGPTSLLNTKMTIKMIRNYATILFLFSCFTPSEGAAAKILLSSPSGKQPLDAVRIPALRLREVMSMLEGLERYQVKTLSRCFSAHRHGSRIEVACKGSLASRIRAPLLVPSLRR